MRLKRSKGNAPYYLPRITKGKDILEIVSGAYSFHTDYDEPETQEEVNLIGEFVDIVQDWGDILLELNAGRRVEVGFTLTNMIKDLENSGFWLFGERENQQLVADGKTSTWPAAIFVIMRSNNPSIVNKSEKDSV